MAVKAKRKFNPSLHPRDSRGRFTRSSTRVMQPADRKRAQAGMNGFAPTKLADQAARQEWLQKASAATPSPGSAIAAYLDGGWRTDNPAFRAGKPVAEVEQLDAAFAPLPEDAMLRRVVPAAMFAHIPIDQLVGMKVRDAAPASTSLDHEGVGAPGAVTMHIAAPAGTRAYVNDDAGEVLLMRDTEVAITRAVARGDGQGWDLFGVVIPRKGAPARQPRKTDDDQAAPAAADQTPTAGTDVPADGEDTAGGVGTGSGGTGGGDGGRVTTTADPATEQTPPIVLWKDAATGRPVYNPGQPEVVRGQVVRDTAREERVRRGMAIAAAAMAGEPEAAAVAGLRPAGDLDAPEVPEVPETPKAKAPKTSKAPAAPAGGAPDTADGDQAAPAGDTDTPTAGTSAPDADQPARLPLPGDAETITAVLAAGAVRLDEDVEAVRAYLLASLGNFTDEATGLTAVASVSFPKTGFLGRVNLRYKVVDAKGKKQGEIKRILEADYFGTVTAEHTSFELNKAVRGAGFAARFNARSETFYRAEGIAKIKLTANIDVGGYAWARAGYDFKTVGDAQMIALKATRIADERGPNGTWDDTAVAAVRDMIARTQEPGDARVSELIRSGLTGDKAMAAARDAVPTPLEWAMAGWTPDSGSGAAAMWPGKEIMLASSWGGEKDLTTPAPDAPTANAPDAPAVDTPDAPAAGTGTPDTDPATPETPDAARPNPREDPTGYAQSLTDEELTTMADRTGLLPRVKKAIAAEQAIRAMTPEQRDLEARLDPAVSTPTRQKWDEHGRPGQVIWFGDGVRPKPRGELATITTDGRGRDPIVMVRGTADDSTLLRRQSVSDRMWLAPPVAPAETDTSTGVDLPPETPAAGTGTPDGPALDAPADATPAAPGSDEALADLATTSVQTHTSADFDAMDPTTDIARGDLVVVKSFNRYRTAVVTGVSDRGRVETLVATPSNPGRVYGARGQAGTDVRLLSKNTTPAPDNAPGAPTAGTAMPDAAPAETDAGTTASTSAPTLADSLNTGIVGEPRAVSGGITALVELTTLGDGTYAIRKTAEDARGRTAKDQQDAEELGALLLRALGNNAPEVQRLNTNQIAMRFVKGDTGASLYTRDIGGAAARERELAASDAGLLLGFADHVAGNPDRTGGNWMIDEDGRLVGIDHGHLFGYNPNAPLDPPKRAVGLFQKAFMARNGHTDNPDNLPNEWSDNDMSPADIAEARARLDALRPEFERLGHTDWHDTARARLDLIGTHATGTRNRLASADDQAPAAVVDTPTAGTGTPGADPDTADLADAVASGEREARPLTGGANATVELVTYDNGTTLVRKTPVPNENDPTPAAQQADAEELASLVYRALGAKAPRVLRTAEDQVVQDYMPGKAGADYTPDDRTPFASTDAGQRLGLGDVLIANDDRHSRNWQVDDDGNVIGIDHALAFNFNQKIVDGDFVPEEADGAPTIPGGIFAAPFLVPYAERRREGSDGWADHEFTPADMAVARERLAALQPRFAEAGRGDWHAMMMARVDQVAPHATGTRNRIASADDQAPTAAVDTPAAGTRAPDAPAGGKLAELSPVDRAALGNAVEDQGPGIFQSPMTGGSFNDVGRYVSEGPAMRPLVDKYGADTVWRAVEEHARANPDVLARTPGEVKERQAERAAGAGERATAAAAATKAGDYSQARAEIDAGEAIDPTHRDNFRSWDEMRAIVARVEAKNAPAADPAPVADLDDLDDPAAGTATPAAGLLSPDAVAAARRKYAGLTPDEPGQTPQAPAADLPPVPRGPGLGAPRTRPADAAPAPARPKPRKQTQAERLDAARRRFAGLDPTEPTTPAPDATPAAGTSTPDPRDTALLATQRMTAGDYQGALDAIADGEATDPAYTGLPGGSWAALRAAVLDGQANSAQLPDGATGVNAPPAIEVPAAQINMDDAQYKRDYERGWKASKNGGDGLERADDRQESEAWYDGWSDYSVDRPKWDTPRRGDAEERARVAGEGYYMVVGYRVDPDTGERTPTTYEVVRGRERLAMSLDGEGIRADLGDGLARGSAAQGTRTYTEWGPVGDDQANLIGGGPRPVAAGGPPPFLPDTTPAAGTSLPADTRPVTFPQLWHVTTSPEAKASIDSNGLRVGDGESDGAVFGRGIYLFADKRAADQYQAGSGYDDVVTAQARVTNPFRVDAKPDAPDGEYLLRRRMAAEGIAGTDEKLTPAEITARLQAAGYDSIYVHQPDGDDDIGGSQLLVFDAADVEVTDAPGDGDNQLPAAPPPLPAEPIRAGSVNTTPLTPNNWGGSGKDSPVHYHPDGEIGRAVDALGPDARLDVDGLPLAEYLNRLATDGARLEITAQDQVDRLRVLAGRLPDGPGKRAVAMAANDLDAPQAPAPDVPEGTPEPLARLMADIWAVPMVRRDGAQAPEIVGLNKAIARASRGRPSGARLAGMVGSDVLNRRHESKEGKTEIDAAARRAMRDLEAPPAPAAGTSAPDAGATKAAPATPTAVVPDDDPFAAMTTPVPRAVPRAATADGTAPGDYETDMFGNVTRFTPASRATIGLGDRAQVGRERQIAAAQQLGLLDDTEAAGGIGAGENLFGLFDMPQADPPAPAPQAPWVDPRAAQAAQVASADLSSWSDEQLAGAFADVSATDELTPEDDAALVRISDEWARREQAMQATVAQVPDDLTALSEDDVVALLVELTSSDGTLDEAAVARVEADLERRTAEAVAANETAALRALAGRDPATMTDDADFEAASAAASDLGEWDAFARIMEAWGAHEDRRRAAEEAARVEAARVDAERRETARIATEAAAAREVAAAAEAERVRVENAMIAARAAAVIPPSDDGSVRSAHQALGEDGTRRVIGPAKYDPIADAADSGPLQSADAKRYAIRAALLNLDEQDRSRLVMAAAEIETPADVRQLGDMELLLETLTGDTPMTGETPEQARAREDRQRFINAEQNRRGMMRLRDEGLEAFARFREKIAAADDLTQLTDAEIGAAPRVLADDPDADLVGKLNSLRVEARRRHNKAQATALAKSLGPTGPAKLANPVAELGDLARMTDGYRDTPYGRDAQKRLLQARALTVGLPITADDKAVAKAERADERSHYERAAWTIAWYRHLGAYADMPKNERGIYWVSGPPDQPDLPEVLLPLPGAKVAKPVDVWEEMKQQAIYDRKAGIQDGAYRYTMALARSYGIPFDPDDRTDAAMRKLGSANAEAMRGDTRTQTQRAASYIAEWRRLAATDGVDPGNPLLYGPADQRPKSLPRTSWVATADEEIRINRAVAAGADWDDAYAQVMGVDPDAMRQAQALSAATGGAKVTEKALKTMYREHVYRQYMDAEDATAGNLLNKTAQAKNIDPESLFSGDPERAYLFASEELMRWWGDNPRLTYTDYKTQIVGNAKVARDRIAQAGKGNQFA